MHAQVFQSAPVITDGRTTSAAPNNVTVRDEQEILTFPDARPPPKKYVALALAQTQQGKDSCLFVRLQDIHSMTSTREGRVMSRQTGADDAGFTSRSRSIQAGEFEVAIPGGIWVAIGDQA